MDSQLKSTKHSRNIPRPPSSTSPASGTKATSNNPGAALRRQRSRGQEHSNVHTKKPIERKSDQQPIQELDISQEQDEDAVGEKILGPPSQSSTELKIVSHDNRPPEAGKPIEAKSDRRSCEGVNNHNANSDSVQHNDGFGKKVLDSASQPSREPKVGTHEHTSLPEPEKAIEPEFDQKSLEGIDNHNWNSNPQDDDGFGKKVLGSASQSSSKPKIEPHEHIGLPVAEKPIDPESNHACPGASGIDNSNSNAQEDSRVLDPTSESLTEPRIIKNEDGKFIIDFEEWAGLLHEKVLKPRRAERAKNDPYLDIRELIEELIWTIQDDIETFYYTDNLDLSDLRALQLNEKGKVIGLGESKPIEIKLPLVNAFMIDRVGSDWEGRSRQEGAPQKWFQSNAINTELLEAYYSWRTYSEIIEPGLRDLWGYVHRVEQDPTFPKLESASDETEKSKWRQLVVERVKSMPDFQDFTQTRSKEFVEEIVGIFRPIRKGYYQYEHLQVYPLERLTEQTIRAHEIVVTMYSEAATGEFIFKYFPHNDKCASSEMIDIKPKPTRMTDAEMDEDGNVVLLTISPAVLKRYVDMNEPVLLCKARVWTTSAASDAGVKRHRERHEEYINGGMAKEFKEINEAMGLGKKRKIST